MNHFAYHHPQAYARLLKGSLLLLLASVSFTAGRTQDWRVQLLTNFTDSPPAAAQTAGTPDTKAVAAPATTQTPAQPAAASVPVKLETNILPPFRGPLSGTNPQIIAQRMVELKFGAGQWPALQQLWQHESGWNPDSRNAFSGACGIPQALPCSKISDHSPAGQIEWGLNYIAKRYGTPSNALAFWKAHHWY